jgi:hypothetical protein
MIASDAAPIGKRRLAVMGLVFALALTAFLLMLAFAPQRFLSEPQAGTAQSRAATGFAGLQRLLPPAGAPDASDTEGNERLLIVILPPEGLSKEFVKTLQDKHGERLTLLVLPKWKVVPEPLKRGRVQSAGLIDPAPRMPEGMGLSVKGNEAPAAGPLEGREYLEGLQVPAARAGQQWLEGEDLQPILVNDRGQAVLAEVGADKLLVLADPDILNNLALADRDRAEAALALVRAANYEDATTAVVVDAADITAESNMLRLLFTPPFLALTLMLLALLLAGGWQALVRFGAPVAPPPAIPPGKAALVDNAAGLLRMAGREALAAPPYAGVVARQAAAECGIPFVDEARLWPQLDAVGDDRFTELAERMQAAGRPDMLEAAQALHHWKEGLKR